MNKLIVRKSILKVSGAKNSVLRLMAASILTQEKVILKNYPSQLLDAQIHVGMLDALGKNCSLIEKETLLIEQDKQIKSQLIWEDRSIRNTLLILGA